MFSAFNPSKYTHTWSSGQPTLRHLGSSWGFGALLKGLTSAVDNSCRSRDSNPQPRVTSPTFYPLGHDCPYLIVQHFNPFRHLDVLKMTCWSSNWASERGRKRDLNDFEHGMFVGARRAGLSISETADLLGFSCTTISRVYWEWSEKEKISSERQLCGRKCLVDVRGQRRMDRLVRDDRKATVTQITTRYNQGMQKTISEHTTQSKPWSRWATAAEDLQMVGSEFGVKNIKAWIILPCLNG